MEMARLATERQRSRRDTGRAIRGRSQVMHRLEVGSRPLLGGVMAVGCVRSGQVARQAYVSRVGWRDRPRYGELPPADGGYAVAAAVSAARISLAICVGGGNPGTWCAGSGSRPSAISSS